MNCGVAVAVAQAGGSSSDLTPSMGTSICHGYGPKKKKFLSFPKVISYVFIAPPPPFLINLGLYLWQMEVSRLGVELELQLLVYTTVTTMWYPSHSNTRPFNPLTEQGQELNPHPHRY